MSLINFFHNKQMTDSYMNTFEKEPDPRDDYYNRAKRLGIEVEYNYKREK